MTDDNTDALIAAAYEAAARKVWLDFYETAEEAAEQIRALIPADAKAALDQALKQARIEGMREAAEIAEAWYRNHGKGTPHGEILALIEKETSDGNG